MLNILIEEAGQRMDEGGELEMISIAKRKPKMAKGGEAIPNNYETISKNTELSTRSYSKGINLLNKKIWDSWTKEQKEHFVSDHEKEFYLPEWKLMDVQYGIKKGKKTYKLSDEALSGGKMKKINFNTPLDAEGGKNWNDLLNEGWENYQIKKTLPELSYEEIISKVGYNSGFENALKEHIRRGQYAKGGEMAKGGEPKVRKNSKKGWAWKPEAEGKVPKSALKKVPTLYLRTKYKEYVEKK
jgi:hypothetical protein